MVVVVFGLLSLFGIGFGRLSEADGVRVVAHRISLAQAATLSR